MRNKKRALIFGVTGQDGAYLAKHLLNLGYDVVGVTRSRRENKWRINLDLLQITNLITVYEDKSDNYCKVRELISRILPNEIYNLAGESSVGVSFERARTSYTSITRLPLWILESIRALNKDIRFYNAGSGEMFGGNGGKPSSINDKHSPKSPYALGKSASFELVRFFRETYGIYAVTGVLFNHESPLRGPNFVTNKLVTGAKEISEGLRSTICFGNIEIERDWGWAADYVKAMEAMLQLRSAQDFVVCTGKAYKLEYFIDVVFRYFNLDWRKHVIIETSLERPHDIPRSLGDPERARAILNWENSISFEDMVVRLCKREL